MTEAEWFSLLEERSSDINGYVTIHNYRDNKEVTLYQQDFKVFCDWLEEQGHPLLKGFRAMAYRAPPCRPFQSTHNDGTYGWNALLCYMEKPYHLSDIPQK